MRGTFLRCLDVLVVNVSMRLKDRGDPDGATTRPNGGERCLSGGLITASS